MGCFMMSGQGREMVTGHVALNGRVLNRVPRRSRASWKRNEHYNKSIKQLYFFFMLVPALGFVVVTFFVFAPDFVVAEALDLPVLINLSPASSSTGFFLSSSSSSGISSSFWFRSQAVIFVAFNHPPTYPIGILQVRGWFCRELLWELAQVLAFVEWHRMNSVVISGREGYHQKHAGSETCRICDYHALLGKGSLRSRGDFLQNKFILVATNAKLDQRIPLILRQEIIVHPLYDLFDCALGGYFISR